MPSSSTVISSTSTADADRMLARLGRQKDAWTRVPIEARAELLRDCLGRLLDVAEEWVERACTAKQLAVDSPWAGEEWISGPMVTVRYVRLLAEALEADGRPGNAAFRVGATGQTIARVFPTNAIDRILYPGVAADVWIEKNKLPTQGKIYRDKRDGRSAPGRVALVLGAGNVGSIPPTDLLYKMFVEDQVVLVKMNPVNEYLGPLLERVFEPLCKRGWLAFAYGGADVGAYLCAHDGVDTLHLTGSDRTYDAIVWGADDAERRRRKAAGSPRVDKPFTAELGCVTPVIVTPGRWTSAEIEFQARNVASMVAHNASFNCTAAKVLVLPDAWRQSAEFVDAVKAALRGIPPRHPYYPGARERYAAFVDRYPQSVALSGDTEHLPWTFIPDLPARAGEYAFGHEAFCGVLAEVRLEAGRTGDPSSFLRNAVRFVNESLWGTLSCNLLVSRAARKALGSGLDHAVADLRYGGVAINLWGGILFGLGVTPWGAFPGHTPAEIGSGIGVVHNSFLFDHPQKAVAWGSSVMVPKPPWFSDHRNLPSLGRKITRFEASPSLGALPGLGLSALLG